MQRSGVQSLTQVGTRIFFVAVDHTSATYGLWVTDGTDSNTVLLRTFDSDSDYRPADLVNTNGTLFFTARSEWWEMGTFYF